MLYLAQHAVVILKKKIGRISFMPAQSRDRCISNKISYTDVTNNGSSKNGHRMLRLAS